MLLWLATFIIGWVIALRPKRSLRRQPLNSGSDNISDSKFQEAGFVGPLLALVVVFFLCCVCGVTGQLFSASLQGTQDPLIDQEDQDQLSRKHSIGEVEAYSHEEPETFGQDPGDGFGWLSQCATPQIRVFPPTPPHFQTQMRPEPIEWSSLSQPYSAVSCNPSVRTTSSIYSHARLSTSSVHSRNANIPSSTSDIFLDTKTKYASGAMDPSTVLNVPRISQKYRRDSLHGSQRGGKPSRPSSRPSMPPAAFWRYAAEKQAGAAFPGSFSNWQSNSHSKKREPSICRYPIITTRPESALTRNSRVHHRNNRAAKRRSYESIRKGILDIENYGDEILCPNLDGERAWEGREVETEVRNREVSRRGQRKKLVKKRQPWDAERRRKSRTKSECMPD
ncbi:hypothetical protein MMC29_004081 [Sticta canariensis]|nr:hypothetical protein [Sticta canariensis]